MKKLNLFAAVTVALATTACNAPAEEALEEELMDSTTEVIVINPEEAEEAEEEVMTEEELMDSTTEVIVINPEEAVEEEAL